jgi:hypothetical protein
MSASWTMTNPARIGGNPMTTATQTATPVAAIPAPRHPSWCNQDQCVAWPAGSVVHTAETTWRAASGQNIAVRVEQVDDIDPAESEGPMVFLEVPRDHDGTIGELTPAEATAVAVQVLTYAAAVGG